MSAERWPREPGHLPDSRRWRTLLLALLALLAPVILALAGATIACSSPAPSRTAAITSPVPRAATASGALSSPETQRAPTAGITSPAAAGPNTCAPVVDFLGHSDALDKTRFEGTSVGGLSALVHDPERDVYSSLVENERTAPARFYTLRVSLERDQLAGVQVVGVTLLRDAAGRPYTGLDFDGEGLALTPGGDLLIASETEPAIRRFSRDGRLLADLPVPPRFLVAPRGEAQTNLTFESLALSPDGRSLYTATEGPLTSDGRAGDGRARIRILRYAVGERGPDGFAPAEQFYYPAEPGQGVSELVALGDGDLLVLERGFIPGFGNSVRAYRVSLAGAGDVAGEASLAAPGLAPLEKSLLVDLARCPTAGARHPAAQRNPLLDNVEGLALGPLLPDTGEGVGRRLLLLQSDDNFSRDQVTRLIALAVHP